MKTRLTIAHTLLILLNVFSYIVSAQPILNFNRITINWPQISLFVQAKCGSDVRMDLTTQNFKVVENGVEINDFTISCPEASRHCCISTALLIDKSDNMGLGNPSGIDAAKAGANAFIDAMDPDGTGCDESDIVSFSDSTKINLLMMNDKVLLKQKVAAITPSGKSYVWDALYNTINAFVDAATQECQGIILMTNGNDNCSWHSIQSIIALALEYRIRIFTIGLGTNIYDEELNRIATETGGKYYKVPKPEQLVMVYKDISSLVGGGFYECEINYIAKGSPASRTISLTLQNLFGCPGTYTRTRKIFSDPDSEYVPIYIRLDQNAVDARGRVIIPLLLDSAIVDTLPPSSFTLLFDTSKIQFDTIKTYQQFFASVPIIPYKLANGCRFIVPLPARVGNSGRLATIRFRVGDPDTDIVCTIKFDDWTFQTGRLKPILKDGAIKIIARKPSVSCMNAVAPTRLQWDTKKNDYSPNPFTVQFDIRNCGTRSAASATATISFDTTKLILSNTMTYTQQCNPFLVDSMSTAIWSLKAKPSAKDDSVLIRCTITFDNHPTLQCETNVFIPKALLTHVENESMYARSFVLEQNYPNPFSTSTTINLSPTLSLNKERESVGQNHLTLKVFDVFGREVLDLSEQIDNSKLTIDNFQLPNAGIYFYRLTIGNQSQTKMMTLIK